MTVGIRGFNPIWYLPDLDGNPLDDTYYLFVLHNELPYLPATVYHDVSCSVPWNQPIEFLANGTLPVDIYWFPDDTVYRLEVRHGDTQADQLIYLVENYVPNTGGGDIPIETETFVSDNMITNPQFSLVSFVSPFTLSDTDPDFIQVAPGWTLSLTGTGTVELDQIALNANDANPTNAPWALELSLSGWDTAILRQRFEQNGMLWCNKFVASSVTARLDGVPQAIQARLINSAGVPLVTVLDPADGVVTEDWQEFTGIGEVPSPTNTNTPPDAWVEYQLILPTDVTISLSSFQLVSTAVETPEVPYSEQTIDRQIDHTFHYYRDSILIQPKESILTGWDFGLNPWQYTDTAQTDLATFGYIADQTIVIQQRYVASAVGNNIATARGTSAQNYGFKVLSRTAQNQFAIIQYIHPSTARPVWGRPISVLANLTVQKQTTGANLRIKARLLYNTSLPSAMSQTYPIASWATGGEPVYAGGWTEVAPQNDPSWNLANGTNQIVFENFDLQASSSDNMTLALILYTVDSMNSAGTPDFIIFNDVSLVPNEFAIDSNTLSYDETLRRCEFYYEKSYSAAVLPGTVDSGGSLIRYQTWDSLIGIGTFYKSAFEFEFKTVKCQPPTSVVLYSPATLNASGNVRGILSQPPAITSADIVVSTGYAAVSLNEKAISYLAANSTPTTITRAIANGLVAYIQFHYTVDSVLGA